MKDDISHPSLPSPKVGVLLVNLGSPDSTKTKDVRRYLKEFLSDRRVIEVNPIIWKVILNVIILNVRPKKSAKAYKTIWNNTLNESPLKTITRAQSDVLGKLMEQSHDTIIVDWAMRYGSPSIESKMNELTELGCQKILLCPLYPQYSGATTATVMDKVFDVLKTMRWQPSVRTLPPFYDDSDYISALAQTITDHIEALNWQPDMVLSSFHGIPKRYHLAGDPYYCHCMKTSRLVKEKTGIDDDKWQTVFQSRFGKEEWLQPYAEPKIIELAQSGVKNLVMVAPAFYSECLETLEEINKGYRRVFLENGGKKFSYVPCLNSTDLSIGVLNKLVTKELSGWI